MKCTTRLEGHSDSKDNWSFRPGPTLILFDPGSVCTGIAKHRGRYSKSDRLCQDGEEKRLWSGIFVKYAVEISNLPLFSSRDICKNKAYRIIGEEQCHSINKCILFEITRMQSVRPSQ